MKLYSNIGTRQLFNFMLNIIAVNTINYKENYCLSVKSKTIYIY